MPTIKLPKLFATVLANNSQLESAVRQNFDLFEPWLEQSGMPFFPGFTDHSPRHINDVLNSAASLVSDESHTLLTAEDVAVLCMAILLHDCGMHLTQDGFRALILDSGQPIITGFNELPWSKLWNDFIAEARRFGQEKLIAIFGDATPIKTNEINYEDLTESNCLLIGEFVRRHHARLAHEMAINGVPNLSGKKLKLVGLDENLLDIAGLVARSHGISIRGTFPYLEMRYSLVAEQCKVKSPFLMAILRIADYIQVQSERALKSLMSVKELRSPISKQEWRNHFAVRNISSWHDDPEAYFIDAAPTDVKTYLKLITLFSNIQRELDESWATIGEVYGRRGELCALGLTMRRIRSSLDEQENFSRSVKYIPIKAGFNSSGPDLLELLVGPLYNYQPEIGIRELIQNAVDACRERSDISEGESKGSEPDVLVNMHENEDGTGWITVTDKGVGMTLETVVNYFLIAGASFRNSDIWKRQHLNEFGKSRIMRGGRFGIGALAAFLLGEEITVRTRHYARPESEGLEFSARIDEHIIELKRCVADAGTSIQILVSDSKILDNMRPSTIDECRSKLDGSNLGDEVILDSWPEVDWFIQSIPKVECRWNGYNRKTKGSDNYASSRPRVKVSAKFTTPSNKLVPLLGTLDSSWKRLKNPGVYEAIYWKYIEPVKSIHGDWHIQPPDEATVNGIRVTKYSPPDEYLKLPDVEFGKGPHCRLRRPSMAIFDSAGICPINLQRNNISFAQMDMDFRMSNAVLKNYLSQIIQSGQLSNTLGEFIKFCAKLAHSRDVVFNGLVAPICVNSDGVFIASPKVFSELKIQTLYIVDVSEITSPLKFADFLKNGEALMLRNATSGPMNDSAFFRGTLSKDASDNYYSQEIGLPMVSISAALAIMPKAKWNFANEKRRISQYILNPLKNSTFEKDCQLVIFGDEEKAKTMLPRCKTLNKLLGKKSEIVAWQLNDIQEHANAKSIVHAIWCELADGLSLVTFK